VFEHPRQPGSGRLPPPGRINQNGFLNNATGRGLDGLSVPIRRMCLMCLPVAVEHKQPPQIFLKRCGKDEDIHSDDGDDDDDA